MKNAFITTITCVAGLTWVYFFLWFENASYPHSGGWQFFLGSGLTLVTVTGIVALKEKGEDEL